MHRVGLILPRDFQLLSLAPLTAFEIAAPEGAEPYYDLHLLSEHGGAMRSSCGLTVETEPVASPDFDTLLVGAVTVFDAPPQTLPQTVTFVRDAAKTSRRIASFCNGAFVLAEAGLLDGRRATTHWAQAAAFKERFPKVKLEEDRLYINDGPIWTSAGMTAGIDLVLAMIGQDLGPEIVKGVAQHMVVNQMRLGGQKQHSALLDMAPKSDRIELVLTHIRENLRDALTIETLAGVAGLSPRQFGRAFMAETGHSPAKAVELLRLEAARFMMERGRHSGNVVAYETGFANRERMRRAFIRAFGLPPQALRQKARLETIGSPPS